MEFLHVKPGKGAAFVRSKLKNLVSGSTMEKTFRAGEPVNEASVIKTDMQFSYDDGSDFQFMNMETYETESVPKSVCSNGQFLLEGMVVQVRRPPNAAWGERPCSAQRILQR
jgi:elongation factor P